MNWEQLLTSVRNAYRNAPNGNQTISTTNYLALLDAFDQMVSIAPQIPPGYETDFRRNMPGGSARIEGTYEEVVGTLAQSIIGARKFAQGSPLYPVAGDCMAENLRAILRLVPQSSISPILTPIQPVLNSIAGGNL